MSGPRPIFHSVWQLIDSVVLFPVQLTPQGEAPAVMPTPDGPCVPTWVDRDRAEAMLAPGFVLRQTPMTALIRATTLRPETGIVVEPGAANEVVVPGPQRLSLQPLCVPFPPGAQTAWGTLPAEAAPLVEELTAAAARLVPLRRLWAARFRVEDAREQVAVVYDTGPDTGPAGADPETDDLVVKALYEHIARVAPAYPVQTISVSDLPEGTREWLLDSVPPIYHEPVVRPI